MTYTSFFFLIALFGGSLYVLEKRPIRLRFLEVMDTKRYPLVMLISMTLIFVLMVIGALVPLLRIVSEAGTIFLASYLVFRYRQGIDRRMKG